MRPPSGLTAPEVLRACRAAGKAAPACYGRFNVQRRRLRGEWQVVSV